MTPVHLRIGRGLPALNAAIEALVLAGLDELRTVPGAAVGSILDGTVTYRRELPGREEWRTRARVLLDGYGDCEDLAAALAVELRARGVPARARIRRARAGTGYHAVVRVGDIELDPSLWLGMGEQ